VGMQTHGQHNRLRAPGSLGASSWPSRVFKGMRIQAKQVMHVLKYKTYKWLKYLQSKTYW